MVRQRTQHGFSLTELLIAMALSGTVLAGIYGTFVQQRRVATSQDQWTEARQIARLTMDALVEELRDAGYDPGGLAGASLLEAGAKRLRFTRDLNCNGTLASSNVANPAKGAPDIPPGRVTSDEDIGYTLTLLQLHPPVKEIRRHVYADGGANPVLTQPLASNILDLEFCYFLDTVPPPAGQCIANPAPEALPNIRAVQVTLTARATAPDLAYTDPNPNHSATFVHYRKSTLTSLVRFRNLGMNLGGGPGVLAEKVDFDQPCALP